MSALAGPAVCGLPVNVLRSTFALRKEVALGAARDIISSNAEPEPKERAEIDCRNVLPC